MVIDIVNLDKRNIKHIIEAAEREGYNIINHLVTDYASGENKFGKEGEKLIGFTIGDMIVALCGLNIESTNTQYGRIRRLYVIPAYRNQKIGSDLVNHLITYAKHYYEGVVVNIGNLPIGHFYESIGFHMVDSPSFTHLVLF